jgi:site-specific recombinase XerD
MEEVREKIRLFPAPVTNQWLERYARAALVGKNEKTVDAYLRILRQVSSWVSQLPGSNRQFHPKLLTKTAFGDYMQALIEQDYSTSHMERVKTVVNGFCQWLIAEGEVQTNPTHGITIPAQELPAPSELSKDQSSVFRTMIDRVREAGDLRGPAIFALGYWAGCRVSDVSYLTQAHTHVGPKVGKLTVGQQQSKYREIILLNQARGPLYDYLERGKRVRSSAYVFTSQRETLPVAKGDLDGWRLGEAAIHEWFKTFKATATYEEWECIEAITFHDLRHDFAHRARKEAGLDGGELAVYLGHISIRRTPATQTTAHSTHPGLEQIREKLSKMKGE